MAYAGELDQLAVTQPASEHLRGFGQYGAIEAAPDQKCRDVSNLRKSALHIIKIVVPCAENLEDVIEASFASVWPGVAFDGAGWNASRISVQPANHNTVRKAQSR